MGILHYESKQEASKPVVSLDDQIHKLLFHSKLKYVWNPGTVQKRIAISIAMFKYINSNCVFYKTVSLWGQVNKPVSQPIA